MAQQFDNTNRAVLFRNERKTQENHPAYTGTANVDGVEYFLDAWVKEGKNGKFFSMSLKRKDKQPAPQAPQRQAAPLAPRGQGGSGFDDMDSDIPF